MVDQSVVYKDITMHIAAEQIKQIAAPALPAGYSYALYTPGRREDWARITTSVKEFSEIEKALAYFDKEFAPHEEELAQRMVFILDEAGLPIATATAWYFLENGREGMLHWVATDPRHQGKGLGSAVVRKAMALFPRLEPGRDAMLHTQTWSHKAVGLYNRLGFCMIKEEKKLNQFAEAMEVLKGVVPENTHRRLLETAI